MMRGPSININQIQMMRGGLVTFMSTSPSAQNLRNTKKVHILKAFSPIHGAVSSRSARLAFRHTAAARLARALSHVGV